MDRAVEQSLEMIVTGVVQTYKLNNQHPMLSSTPVDDKTLLEVSLEPGRSRRQKQGDALGNNTIGAYRKEILYMWPRGSLEDAKKMSRSEIHRTL